ncbi:ATP-binding protein [Ahrensia sp. 13_GOM-1096m]|uniref:ATP-binding protein n=1 Tax=Ahrensia sp. 13_GOM-1096m TaxID=1380380 RepID=UPI00054FC32C|nr:ATP-binding protein [Ahrensia sp. 13_GOM-1096m]
MKAFSLTRRVTILSSAWTVLAIVILGWLLLAQFKAGAERNFSELQQAQLFSLIGAVDINENGNLTGAPNLGENSFLAPESGWFWRVEIIGDTPNNALASPSLSGFTFPRADLNSVPYDNQFVRTYFVNGPKKLKIRVKESEIDLGEGRIALFQVGGNQSEFERGIRDFALNAAGLLSAFGLGVVVINVLVILFGLKPLDRIRIALGEIRDGRADKLSGDFPTELEPMISEMNTLVENNKRIVERARTQVGNLAHSLKTPIAVLQNEGRSDTPVSSQIVRTQAASMQIQVDHYLNRARIAAQQGSLTFRTDIIQAIERMAKVMRKLNPDLAIKVDISADQLLFAGEKEDFEEILGNLVENACKWASGKVLISARLDARNDTERPWIILSVEDDGEGIPQDGYEKALKRGQRLDEKVPGTGLGLSIVNDTAIAYGGDVVLGKSDLGGLQVFVHLPAVNSN